MDRKLLTEKVYIAIARHFENSATAPVTVTLVSTDKSLALAKSGGLDPTITWTSNITGGTDESAKTVEIILTVDESLHQYGCSRHTRANLRTHYHNRKRYDFVTFLKGTIMTAKFKIAQLERHPRDGVVMTAHWTASKTEA